ncbi:MAG: tetratricopeptide repeat protein [Rhodocyclaceae bacterium]|jgi:tetratricopeptide (TPR) repeat protein|nr:tetratricopeptide repeat protein [Rhodocyclaceae bacterium]
MPLLPARFAPLSPSARRYVTAGLAALSVAASMCARADTVQDAGALIKQGKFAQAQELLDKALAQKPSDPQARFLKGIALTEMGKTDAAIGLFQKLTEEFPTLPEPYNNLAVIYAQQKQYDKAKTALETAIRTHPAYATAHENLGDIYARLATQAYDKALQLDSSNSSAQQKLALIRDLMGSPAKIGKPVPPEPVKPVVVASAPQVPTPPPAVIAPPAPAPVVPTTVAAPVAEPKPAMPKPAEPPTQPAANETKKVATAVESWAAAWQRKDVKNYLAAYAKEFKVPGGKSRSAWETERRQRIDRPGDIEVSVANLKVSVDGNRAVASFRQGYRSGKLDINTSKRLDMIQRDGRWQIVQESVGG